MCKDKGQNRIDYIVLHKPDDAAKLLEKHGYQAPNRKEDLPKAVKLLVKRKGEPFIKELLNIHPEKELILEITGHKAGEDSYCGCHSAYSGDTKKLLDQLSELSVADLEQLYDDAKKNAREKPEDKPLVAKVELLWDELKRRKKQTELSAKKDQESTETYWLKLGAAFLFGVMIAKLA